MTPRNGRAQVLNLRQWKRLRELHDSRYVPPAPRRQPSRRGLLVASVVFILGAVFCFWLMLEAALPTGVGR